MGVIANDSFNGWCPSWCQPSSFLGTGNARALAKFYCPFIFSLFFINCFVLMLKSYSLMWHYYWQCRKVLEVGVLTWSLATMFVPLVAGFMPGLVLSRILVSTIKFKSGICYGVCKPVANVVIFSSPTQRSYLLCAHFFIVSMFLLLKLVWFVIIFVSTFIFRLVLEKVYPLQLPLI